MSDTPQFNQRPGTKELQSEVKKRVGPNGQPVEGPRLNQGRVPQQPRPANPAQSAPSPIPKKTEWVKWLPWIATGTALGGTLAATYFDWLP